MCNNITIIAIPIIVYAQTFFRFISKSYHVQYRSDSLSINPACASGACTDFEYIECTIAIIDGIAQ